MNNYNPIYAAKQVGDVSYLVEDIPTLIQVIESQEIWASESPEYNPNTGKKSRYVSLSRNLTSAAKRNNKRWNCGILIDGDKLSNHYHIEPYSFAGVGITQNKYRVKTITQYSDGSHTMNLVNWPTMEISQSFYDEVENIINSLPEDFKSKKNYTYSGEGKLIRNGRKIVERHHFNTKLGGPILNLSNLSESAASYLLKHEKVNETEERIWLNNHQSSVNVSGCILGVVLSDKDAKLLQENSSNDEIYDELYSVINRIIGSNYVLITY